jgi:hypothetical protein
MISVYLPASADRDLVGQALADAIGPEMWADLFRVETSPAATAEADQLAAAARMSVPPVAVFYYAAVRVEQDLDRTTTQRRELVNGLTAVWANTLAGMFEVAAQFGACVVVPPDKLQGGATEAVAHYRTVDF